MRWASLIIPVTLLTGDISEYSNIYEVGSALDRCCNSYCLAEVRTTKPDLVVETFNQSNTLSIYFEEGSSSVTAESTSRIREFLESNPNLTNITLIGNTDGCGLPTYNVGLSGRRANAVKREILNFRDSSIQMRWAGEIVSNHSSMARRVDIVATSQVRLSEPMPELIADFYLIDSSGSMAGGDWQRIIRSVSFHRPRGSRVFLSTTRCIPRGSNVNIINPGGPTEIWMSYWKIIDYMSPGQTLLIVSDFDSSYPLQPWERNMISNKVLEKNIIVRTVRL